MFVRLEEFWRVGIKYWKSVRSIVVVNINGLIRPKFWTQEKLDWFKAEPDFDPKDLGAKKEMVGRFKKVFGSDKSDAVIYRKFRMMHPLRKKKGQASRAGKNGRVLRARYNLREI